MRKGTKVPRLQLITNEKGRRRQYEKRKTSLEKAAKDLSTLCGVDIGMVVFGPHKDPEEQPSLWNQQALTGLIEGYKARQSHDSRTKTYDPSDYLKEKTEKMKDDLDKLRFKFDFKSPEEARRFHDGLVAKIDAVRTRINLMKGSSRFSNNNSFYYNNNNNPPAVQESLWKYEQQQQQQVLQPNFVYYSNDNNINNQMMTGYNNMYGGASNGGVYNMYNDQNNNYVASNYGTYGGMMNTNYAKPPPQPMMLSYNNDAGPCGGGSCYLPPPKVEPQQTMALEWFSPDGFGQAQWFLNDQSC